MSSPESPETHAFASASLCPASDVVARGLGESAVLVRLSTNKIYELNATGARIWDLVVARATRDEIVDTLQREFAEDAVGIPAAVDELLATFRAEGLI